MRVSANRHSGLRGGIILWRFSRYIDFHKRRKVLEILGTGNQKTGHITLVDKLLVSKRVDCLLQRSEGKDGFLDNVSLVRDQDLWITYHTEFPWQFAGIKEGLLQFHVRCNALGAWVGGRVHTAVQWNIIGVKGGT